MLRTFARLCLLIAAPPVGAALAQTSGTVPAAITAITERELKRDLYLLAGDAMRGREEIGRASCRERVLVAV